jgi:chromatin segregation and condensation protein Rec8/ScpA/Scc1 (kleisin family)
VSAPLSPNQVAAHLAELARDLDTTVSQLKEADRDATEKRAAADLANSRAFLEATGAMDLRKHQAVVSTAQQRLDADVAEALVRHLRRRLDALRVRIDVGRSYGAALRAEIGLAGSRDMP